MWIRGQKPGAWPVAAAFASVLMVECADETPVQEAQDEGTEAAAAGLNETVTFDNEVTEVHGPSLFTVGEEDTPVVGFAAAAGFEDGDRVEVTGTVRQIVLTDVEAWGGFDVDQDENIYLLERELDLGVVAEDVQPLPDEYAARTSPRRRCHRLTCPTAVSPSSLRQLPALVAGRAVQQVEARPRGLFFTPFPPVLWGGAQGVPRRAPWTGPWPGVPSVAPVHRRDRRCRPSLRIRAAPRTVESSC